jgi:hypothetical protein
MSAVFLRAFRERESVRWLPFDASNALDVAAIYDPAYSDVDINGLRIESGHPVICIRISVLKSLRPDRSDDALLDNRDTFIVAGASYDVDSFDADGHDIVRVHISKARVE